MGVVVEFQTIADILLPLFLLIAFKYIFRLYSNYRTKVRVGAGNPPIRQVVIAYKFARDSYDTASSLIREVRETVPGATCLGIYYDDPDLVNYKEVRYAVGAILAEGTEEVDEEEVKLLEDAGFSIFHLPQVENVVRSTFPNVTFLSIYTASLKVYPTMRRYVKKHGLCAHPFLEVYQDKIIHFMVPLSRQGDFYVPEALPLLEYEESYEAFSGDDSTQDLSQSNILASSDDEAQTEDGDLESSVSSQEPENWPQEVGALPQAVPGQEREIESDEDSMSSFEELEFDPEMAGDYCVQ